MKTIYRKVRKQAISRNRSRGKKGMVFLPSKLIGKKVIVKYYD